MVALIVIINVLEKERWGNSSKDINSIKLELLESFFFLMHFLYDVCKESYLQEHYDVVIFFL